MPKKNKEKKNNKKSNSIFENNQDNIISNDVILYNISVKVPGKTLIENSDLKLAFGNKYGLLGINGSGKTTLLKNIYGSELGIKLDRYYVDQEVQVSDTETVFETIFKSNKIHYELIQKLKELEIKLESDDSDETMNEYQKITDYTSQLQIDKDESIIRKILYGLGFSLEEHDKPTAEFSGGWRMRMSLARALYLKPSLLLLDEPTNHLDLNATIWLSDYLKNEWKNTLVIVSHDTNFINEVCTDIINLYQKKLCYYSKPKSGNYGIYGSFLKLFDIELKTNEKKYNELMRKVKDLQKKSTPKKEINEIISKSGIERPPKPYKVTINFYDVYKLDPPVIDFENVSFGYTKDKYIYTNLTFKLNQQSRICIVGPNGIGKSTLLKLMTNTIKPSSGNIYYNNRLRIGYYHQHSAEYLPIEQTPIEYIYDLDKTLKQQDIHKLLGSIGLEGSIHNKQIKLLSGGQKSRVAFIGATIIKPHILFLDEPTNHLDIESVEALINSINDFNGGIVMVTHNVDLICKTDCVLWNISKNSITETDYETYKEEILEELNKLEN